MKYDVYSGGYDVPLPVINHLPGFTPSQELQFGVLALSDGTTQIIAAGDTTALTAIGVTNVIAGNRATLKVDVSDKAYYGGTL